MTCDINKIDSNVTGLSFAEEACLKDLPNMADDGYDPEWFPLEPNSYSDFGGTVTSVARNPINSSRQRKKGTITDLEASGGFNQDLTFYNTTRLLQGFMFADAREKKNTKPINGGAAIPITGVTAIDDTYAAASGLGTFLAGHIVMAEGFGIAANNGLKNVVSSTASTVVVSESLTDEASPPAAAKLSVVGFLLEAGEADITMNGDLVRLTCDTTDLSTLGLIAGEWIFVGGDAANSYFANNRGFARISVVNADYLEFDKVDWEPAAESGAAFTIQLYFGSVLKNESAANLIKRRSYHLERTLGQDANGTMSEYLTGAVPNELSINIPQADKVNCDFGFVACDHEVRTGTQGVKSGNRNTVEEGDAFNTSSNFNRIKIASVSDTDASVTPLFAFATDFTITINNNVSANKAVGVLGAFDTSAGTFEVGGSFTGYFADVSAVSAVRNNSSVTLDAIMVQNNTGFVIDLPLLTLGNGRLAVEQDQPITLPLDASAVESPFGHTLLIQYFPYLPNAAS